MDADIQVISKIVQFKLIKQSQLMAKRQHHVASSSHQNENEAKLVAEW
jgi:hypothetical protein